jgi:hypothetical protein
MPYSASEFASMKGNIHEHTPLVPRGEREILDEIRSDHELIGRLKITPQELEALSKCALLGTLTCKQDMLFILRQIREAGRPDHATRVPQPADLEDREEDPVPAMHRVIGVDPVALENHAPLNGAPRRRMPEKFGIMFWVVILVMGLVWNGVVAMSRWRDSFLTDIGTPASQVASSDAWFGNIDRFSVLLFWELLFVAGIATVVYLKTRRGNRRLKVRPARSWR